MKNEQTIEEEFGKDFGNCTIEDLKKYPPLYKLLKNEHTNN